MSDVIEIKTIASEAVEIITDGPQGAPGVGVPTGGSTGQVLRKASGTDYDTEWSSSGGGSVDLGSPDPIGDVVPNTGAFTTLTAVTGNFTTISASGTATLSHIHGSLAGNLYIHVKNVSGGELARGTPVYIVGNVGDTDRVEVAAADFDDATKMPAVGLLEQTLANNGTGDAVIAGELTSANTGSYSLNQELFVGNNGALTTTRPTTGEVQSVGTVGRVHASTGVIVVNVQGRRSPNETFAAATHASRHFTAGADPISPADIGAQAQLARTSVVVSEDTVLSANRNQQINLVVYGNVVANVTLPYIDIQNGDLLTITTEFFGSPSITLRRVISTSPLIYETIRVLQTSGEKYQFIVNTAAWATLTVVTHTHAASDITSGTLAHERGGLEADVSAYNGLVKIASGSTSAVTVTSAGEALLDDADASAQRTTLGLGNSATLNTGTTAGTVAAGDHAHAQLHDRSHAITSASDHTAGNNKIFYSDNTGAITELALGANGTVLTSNGASSAPSFAAASGGVSSVDATTADVFSVSGSNLVADDGGLINSANPAVVWDDVAGKLVYANPLARPSGAGAMFIGLAPSTTALGTNAICIQTSRSNANQVAADTDSIVIGTNARTASGGAIARQIAIGQGALASNRSAVAIGGASNASEDATAIGDQANASQATAVAIGIAAAASAPQAVVVGRTSTASADLATAVGPSVTANLRSQFITRTFGTIYWGGQTTNATATILNLDAQATNRFTIAASTALAVDILLVARRSDVADKWLVARRFLGIRRDGSNNTSLIGSVQTLGTDQSAGSPTWTFALTADDTNEALQLEVTGATGETVQWRATAFYRVV